MFYAKEETLWQMYTHYAVYELYEDDIENVDPSVIRSEALGDSGLDLLIVCAPCQPFSTQNQKKGNDPRERLIFHSLKFVEELQPNIVFFENVPGLGSSNIHDDLRCELQGLGYHLAGPLNVDASDLGVPQRRLRCIMVASKKPITACSISHSLPRLPLQTVRQTIGTLPSLATGEYDPDDNLHFARNHRPIALRRLSHIPKDGGSRFSLPEELILNCHRDRDDNSFPDVYGRMAWDDVAPTLTTGCTDLTKGRFAHPEDDRAISLREAALLQTFPRTYRFVGNYSQIATQIGNAVPVRMIENLVPFFRKIIRG